MMTPIVKSFSAEKGFESNALAVQIHGGYGYTSEYLPEAWLRDQKLNSIHEGTTCMHSMDLLGRKVVAEQGGALRLLADEIGVTLRRATAAGVDTEWVAALDRAVARVGELTMQLASLGMGGQVDAMMLHSVDYLDLFSTLVIAWQWLLQATVAKEKLASANGVRGVLRGEGLRRRVLDQDRAASRRPARGAVQRRRGLVRSHEGRLVLKPPATSDSAGHSAETATSFSVTSFRCRKTLCAIDMVGTASSAPGTRKKCSPARSEKMTSTGWIFAASPMIFGLSTFASSW